MRRRRLTVLGVLVLLVAGCSGGGKSGGAEKAPASSSTSAPAAAAPGVTVTAREYAFDVPAVIEGGVVRMTLQNNGKLKHEAVIVAAGNTPLAQLKRDLAPIARSAGQTTPASLRFRGGVSLVGAGTSAASTLTLPAGKYVMVCTLTDADSLDPATAGAPPTRADRFHFDLGMAVPFTVTATNTLAMPPTDGTVLARDWSFELPPVTPGTRTWTFRNDGQQDHSAAVAEFADGIDAAAARTAFDSFLAADANHPPPADAPVPTDVAFAGPLSSGAEATFTVDLKPNRTYVFACYMTDRSGGEQHAKAKNMVAYATTPTG